MVWFGLFCLFLLQWEEIENEKHEYLSLSNKKVEFMHRNTASIDDWRNAFLLHWKMELCVSTQFNDIVDHFTFGFEKKAHTHTHTVSRSQVHTYTGTLSLDADTHVSHCCLFKFSNWLINKRPNVRETNYSRSIDNRLL